MMGCIVWGWGCGALTYVCLDEFILFVMGYSYLKTGLWEDILGPGRALNEGGISGEEGIAGLVALN